MGDAAPLLETETTMTTTQTTTGRGMFGRWAAAAALAASLGAGMAASAAAESPRARSAPARTDVQRVFPQRNNTQLVDFYRGGRWVMRVDVSQPGWIYELRADVLALAPLSWVRYPANAPVSFATVQYLLPNRQWVTLPQLQALQAASRGQGQPSAGQGRVYAGQEGTLGEGKMRGERCGNDDRFDGLIVENVLEIGRGGADRITLRDADKVPGSGVLTDHFSDGATFTLRDAARLMIGVSDNTATNLVLDKIGIKPVNQRMEAWGYPNTKINAKVYRGSTTSVDPARTKQFGLGSTTARVWHLPVKVATLGQAPSATNPAGTVPRCALNSSYGASLLPNGKALILSAFSSPDDRKTPVTIVSGSLDRTIRLWEAPGKR
jgi:hypothetical protein